MVRSWQHLRVMIKGFCSDLLILNRAINKVPWTQSNLKIAQQDPNFKWVVSRRDIRCMSTAQNHFSILLPCETLGTELQHMAHLHWQLSKITMMCWCAPLPWMLWWELIVFYFYFIYLRVCVFPLQLLAVFGGWAPVRLRWTCSSCCFGTSWCLLHRAKNTQEIQKRLAFRKCSNIYEFLNRVNTILNSSTVCCLL